MKSGHFLFIVLEMHSRGQSIVIALLEGCQVPMWDTGSACVTLALPFFYENNNVCTVDMAGAFLTLWTGPDLYSEQGT